MQQLYLVYCRCYLQNKIYCIIDTFDNKPAPSRCYISSFSCNNCYDSLLCLQNQLFSCIQTWLHCCFVIEFSVYSSIDWKHRIPVPISRYKILNTQHSQKYSKLWLNIQFSKASTSYAIPLQLSFIYSNFNSTCNKVFLKCEFFIPTCENSWRQPPFWKNFIMSQCTVSDISPTKYDFL